MKNPRYLKIATLIVYVFVASVGLYFLKYTIFANPCILVLTSVGMRCPLLKDFA